MQRATDRRTKTRSRATRRIKGASGNKAATDVQQRALNVVTQQLLSAQDEGDYQLYGVSAKDFATDAKGVLALHNTCKELASHNAKDWYDNILFCYHENKEEARMADQEAFMLEERQKLEQLTCFFFVSTSVVVCSPPLFH